MPKLKPGTIVPTALEAAAIHAAAATDPDNPTWIDDDYAKAQPASKALPPDLFAAAIGKRPPGRPKAEQTKIPTALRLSADALARWKGKGPGWQTRIDEQLAERFAVFEVMHGTAGLAIIYGPSAECWDAVEGMPRDDYFVRNPQPTLEGAKDWAEDLRTFYDRTPMSSAWEVEVMPAVEWKARRKARAIPLAPDRFV